MGDPVVNAIIAAACAVLVLTLIARLWQWRRERSAAARRRAEWRQRRDYAALRQQEIERLARRIIATSSTASIAGFSIVRQIEAVFTDGHPSPTRAVEHLKAVAADKGANAIVNLKTVGPPAGKCAAQGDAVIVRAIENQAQPAASAHAEAPPPPGQTPHEPA